MFAVLKTGGKQYKVVSGDILRVEKLDAAAGDKVQFKKIKTSSGGVLSMVLGKLQPNLPKQAIESLETEALWARTGQ